MAAPDSSSSSSFFFFCLWVVSVFSVGLGCPDPCTCADKYGRHFAECSFKDLAEVPVNFPPNVTTLSLSANRITAIPLGSFDNVTQVTSLWMAHNKIVSVEAGTLGVLVHLRNLDVSHNRIVDFPWEDLQNLTDLQLLKMNHNEMENLPKDTFANLKDLRSLRLNDNRFTTIAAGTFDGLISLSHLQIYNNPFDCICSLDWLRVWISATTITVPDQNLIVCATPETLKGEVIVNLTESKCLSPNVTIKTKSKAHNMTFSEGSVLELTCDFKGNPEPLVKWSIQSQNKNRELVLSLVEGDSAESTVDSLKSVKVHPNGTLVISHLQKEDAGTYSCSATNRFGRSEDSVLVRVLALPKPTPVRETTTMRSYPKTPPPVLQTTSTRSVFDSDVERKDLINTDPTVLPTAEMKTYEGEPSYLSHGSKCGLTADTEYVSSHVFNGSFEDVKQYTFDFGVIALGVSETEATIRLSPLLKAKEKTASGADSSESSGSDSNGLYLCIATDRKHSAVQWTRIKDGVNTYQFTGLRPGTNYSLCLTYRDEDCEVQVLFTTRRRVPNLLIIISVSICLLTMSTVPLLGATCFHLVYKYRSKTYKLILKAKDQYQMERANFNIHAPHTESQRQINGSQLDEEEEEETESADGDKEADTEESVVTESVTLSQCRGNVDDCEVGSEYSDRLPLGAEAINITSNYKYPYQ